MHCTHQGKGDAILFIHGMPTNHMLWTGVIERLSSHHRCFALDLPGMGATAFTPYGTDYLDRMAEQIELLRIRHGVTRWHVVGHDAGSAIAVQYASRFARNVACLALLSPAIFPELKPFYLLNPLRKPLLGEVLAPLVHFIFWQIAMRRAITGESSAHLLRSFYAPFSGLSGAWQLMRVVRWGRPEAMLGELPRKLSVLPMPTLLVHGMRDVLPATFAERAASLIPHSSVVSLDAGHFIPIDRPDEVTACLRSFFLENRAAMAVPSPTRKIRKRVAQALTVVPAARSLNGHCSVASIP